jgi:uncharacterized protein (DUF4415 family)
MSKKPSPELIDDENPEWSDTMLKESVRFGGLPASLQAKPRGLPKAAVTKERISIRLSRDVVERFRASGDGWQTRMDAALQDWLKSHTPALRLSAQTRCQCPADSIFSPTHS